jgi:hypothetical protein
MSKVDWEFEAEYIQSCNCDYGCPCNFNGLPTYDNCEALVAYKIRKGHFGKTKLDGVVFALAAWWPKAIHLGNGIARIYVNTGANAEQFAAITEISSGQHGGGVFEIFAKTFREVYPARQAKIDFVYDGHNSRFTVEGVGEVRSEPIRNPVTGAEFRGQIVLPDGLQWKQAEVTNIAAWWMHDQALLARHENRAGFCTTVRMNPTGCVG